MAIDLVGNQQFKSVYFPDFKDRATKSKSFTLAFSDSENKLFESIKHLSSHEVRQILGTDTYKVLESLAQDKGLPVNRYCLLELKEKISTKNKDFNLDPIHTTFKGGKELPLQSWYPYLEGYSPDFVKYIIDNFVDAKAKVIYDPFSGTGTTPLIASSLGYTAYYSEVNPLLQFLTKIKAKARNAPNKEKIALSLEALLPNLKKNILFHDEDQELQKSYIATFGNSKFFSNEVYTYILKTRTYVNNLFYKDVLVSELMTVAVLSNLVENSYLKRHGDLRFRRGKEIDDLKNVDYFDNLKKHILNIIKDLRIIEPSVAPVLITEDARNIGKLPQLGIDAVITSPPYLNGTNYFRNTKIELWFLEYLKSSSDLTNFRRLAVTAGINDVSFQIEKTTNDKQLYSLLKDLKKNAYDKRIPKMVNDYFADMHKIFSNLKKQLNKDALIAIDLGDSIYGGIHVKTDEILISILKDMGYSFEKNITLRKRQSNNGQELKQVLLIFRNKEVYKPLKQKKDWETGWSHFKNFLPHHSGEMAKRNWGDPIHSLCSYQGKLKPSIANQLVSIFVPENGKILDMFGGVGTIPVEAALQNKESFSFDISPAAVAISRAKIGVPSIRKINQIISELGEYINKENLSRDEIEKYAEFGLNKTLKDYFHPKTLREILLARKYFTSVGYETNEHSFVISAVMHVLHGNRPYALSRRSHGITPFAPTGEFEYKNLIEKVTEKVSRTLKDTSRDNFKTGLVYFQDATKTWPENVKDLDAIITSPPFFDSTRFYAANWMRLWFAGWDQTHFKTEPISFIDELQKKDLSIYDGIFMQARERLKTGGVFILHLGKSQKCNMAKELSRRAERWFVVNDIFEESVEDGESHGIKDRGSVKTHQYLVLT